MFRLDNILEKWATIYKPLSHSMAAKAKPQDKSFFRIDRLDVENEWSRNQNMLDHPVLLFSTAVDAEISRQKSKTISYAWGMFIAVRQKSVNNAAADLDAFECKMRLNDMVIDLMAFLYDLQSFCSGSSWRTETPQAVRDIGEHLTSDERQQVRGMRLDESRWWSTPKYLSGWWLMGIEFEQLDPRLLCVNPNRYIE